MGGLPQEQYRVHSSEKPAATGIRYDPLLYGLKPTTYRVRHFGHSAQWRIRGIIASIDQGEISGSCPERIHSPPLSGAPNECLGESSSFRLALPIANCADNSVGNCKVSVDPHPQVFEVLGSGKCIRVLSQVTEVVVFTYESDGEHTHKIIGQDGWHHIWTVFIFQPIVASTP
jgi:hypothetical protein